MKLIQKLTEWWRLKVFKGIEINLTGPICTCEEQAFTWGIWNDTKGNPGLYVTCKKCETKLTVPNSKFVAHFSLDKAYPGKKAEKKEEPKLKGLDGGKVLDFKGAPEDSKV